MCVVWGLPRVSSPSRQSKPRLMTSISSTCDFGHCSISALTRFDRTAACPCRCNKGCRGRSSTSTAVPTEIRPDAFSTQTTQEQQAPLSHQPPCPVSCLPVSDSSCCVAALCAELHRSLVERESSWLDRMQSHQPELVGTAMRFFMGHLSMTASQLHAPTVIDEAAASLR